MAGNAREFGEGDQPIDKRLWIPHSYAGSISVLFGIASGAVDLFLWWRAKHPRHFDSLATAGLIVSPIMSVTGLVFGFIGLCRWRKRLLPLIGGALALGGLVAFAFLKFPLAWIIGE